MKTKIYQNKMRAFFSVLIILLSAGAVAQTSDNVSRDVVVERDYNPSEIKATKINTAPVIDDYKPEQPTLNYIGTATSKEVKAPANKARADKYQVKQTYDDKNGFAKLGLGFYWQVLGEFYYPLIKKDNDLLDINVNHFSNWGKIKLDDDTNPRAAMHTTDAILKYEHQFRNNKLISAARFAQNNYDYYGMSTVPLELDTIKNTTLSYTTFGFNFDLFSTKLQSTKSYNMKLGYNYYGNNWSFNQHQIVFGGSFAGQLSNGVLGAEIKLDARIYNCDTLRLSNPALKSNCLIVLKPFYKIEKKYWDLKIGANMFILGEKEAERVVTGSADAQLHIALVPGLFHLYAGLGGDFSDNSYKHIMAENPYVRPDLAVAPTYKPLDFDASLKINVAKGLLFDVGLDYELILDQYFYVNDDFGAEYFNTFSVETDSTLNKLTVDAGLYYDAVKNLDLSAVVKYNYYKLSTLEKPWQKPAWEFSFNAAYTFKEKFRVGLEYDMQVGRYAKVCGEAVKMNDIHDLNLSFSYKALDWLNVWIVGKNLINIKSDRYYGYRNFGINGLIGATMVF